MSTTKLNRVHELLDDFFSSMIVSSVRYLCPERAELTDEEISKAVFPSGESSFDFLNGMILSVSNDVEAIETMLDNLHSFFDIMIQDIAKQK